MNQEKLITDGVVRNSQSAGSATRVVDAPKVSKTVNEEFGNCSKVRLMKGGDWVIPYSVKF